VEKVILCWSGGKDSALALHELQQGSNYEVATLLTTITEDYDRVSMHGVRRSLLEEQARHIGLPIERVFITKDASNDDYASRMTAALNRYKRQGVLRVAFGDIFLEEVREYRERNLARVGMRGLFPLWGKDSAELARSFITLGFQAIITCVDTRALDKSFSGRLLDAAFLDDLPSGVDPCGENGEFHSFVFDGPVFREKVAFEIGEQLLRGSFHFCDLIPKGR
jgi:uncharacterized protein (TIGR00290 family)